MYFDYRLFFLIIQVVFIINDSSKNESFQMICFSSIRERFVGIRVNKGSDLLKASKESLQIAIFDYLMAQKRLSEIRSMESGTSSHDLEQAIVDYKNAFNNLKIAKSKWESLAKVIPGFSFREENIFSDNTRFNLFGSNIGLLSDYRIKDYNGDRGIDFPNQFVEENDSIYHKPSPQDKLNKEMIEKLDLGFKYNELPTKFIKLIEERDASRKQNRFKSKRGITGKSNLDDYSLGSKNYKYNKGAKNYNQILSEFQSKKDLFLEDIDKNFASTLEGIFEDLSIKEDADFISEDLHIEKNKDKSGLRKISNKYKSALKTKNKVKRSRGALENEPIFPTDVASEVERFIGGPMKHINIPSDELDKNETLSKLYSEYLRITLKCIHLYEEKSTFEELFLCSKKQTKAMFNLVQVLSDLNIKYDYDKNYIDRIKKKIRHGNVKTKKRNESLENENFFKFLLENNIFNDQSNKDEINNYNGSEVHNYTRIYTKPNENTYFIYEKPNYLDTFMERFKFTEKEYYSSFELSNNIDLLAHLEAEIYQNITRKEPVLADELLRHKAISDLISRDLRNQRFRTYFNNTNDQNS